MKTFYDIINETKNVDKIYKVVGDDGSIQSIWPDKEEAEKEKTKANSEIGGNYFKVETENATEFI